MTIGSGSNRALCTQVCFSTKTVSAITVTWDNGASNQALASIVSGSGTGVTGRAELWGLVNPISGAKTLRVSWTTASDVVINGVSWTSVDQTGGATTFANSTSGTGAGSGPSRAVTSAVGNAVMWASASDGGNYSGNNQTATFTDNTPTNMSTAGQRAAGAASVTGSWTSPSAASEHWVVVGVDIVAASGGGGVTTAQESGIFSQQVQAGMVGLTYL